MERRIRLVVRFIIVIAAIMTLLMAAGCAKQQYRNDSGLSGETRSQRSMQAKKRGAARTRYAPLTAPEVRNLKITQVGEKAVATYDLVAPAGVQEADVVISINVAGAVRTAEELTLSGDFGYAVKVGPGKSITWEAVEDLPENFDGELSWDVKASAVTPASLEMKKAIEQAKLVQVVNLQVVQVGSNAVATYDLVAREGVLEADVDVGIIVSGERRGADKLSVTGDFGKGVKVGRGKKLVWNAAADLASDFDGEVKWDIKASIPDPVSGRKN